MKGGVFFALLCLAVTSSWGARIKIHLVKESIEKYQAHVFKRQSAQDTSCSDAVAVERGSLTLPGRLNDMDDRVRFYRSEMAIANLDSFQDITEVPLMDFPRTLLREVLDVLRNNSCLPFFFGGAVRDQFLGDSPNDADVEIDCTIETFLNVCISAWGESNCDRSNSRPLGHIGVANSEVDNVDLASTDITFYANISMLEYTANSMAYDLNGLSVIIDLTGTGQMDVCNKSIRIPSDDGSLASWNAWLAGTAGTALLRFWKLRIKGFTAYNTGTLQFIVTRSIDRLKTRPNDFGKFYCSNVYSSSYIPAERRCNVTVDMCTGGQGKAELYNAAFAEDFGQNWTTFIQPNLLPTCGSGGSGGTAMKYSLGVVLVLLMAQFIAMA